MLLQLAKFFVVFLLKLLFELLGLIPLYFFMKPLLKANENAPGAPWTNSITFPPDIVMKSQWKMFLEFPGQIPLCFLIKSLLNMNGNWSEN